MATINKSKKNNVRFEKFSVTFKHKIMEYNTPQHVKIFYHVDKLFTYGNMSLIQCMKTKN